MIIVLRLGHRLPRDERISTHVCLVARAFGADEVVVSGEKDEGLIESVRDVVSRWGGDFKASYVKNWKKFLLEKKSNGFKIVHLTMYGIPVDEKIEEIRKEKNLVIIVGSEKVPSEVYQIADWNMAIGNQPHSEISALAIFLDRYFKGKELSKEFNGKIKVIPQEHGKKVIKM